MRGSRVVALSALGALVVFVVLVAALQGDAATTLVVGVLAAATLVAWWRRNSSAAGSVLSLAMTLLGTSMTTEWAGDQTTLVSPLQAGLVFWLFAFVVVAVVWLVPSRGRNRALTTALAHVVLVAASLFIVVAPSAAPIAGLCGAMTVVWWRARHRRGRLPPGSDVAAPFDRVAELRGANRTADVLSSFCPPQWRLLGPRVLPDGSTTRALEQLLVGPPGVIVVETRSWQGKVALVEVPGRGGPTHAYALDGDATGLAARLAPIARNVGGLAELLGLDAAHAYGLVVFWDGTRLPADPVELTVVTENTPVALVLVNSDQLATWLLAQPSRMSSRHVRAIARDLMTNLVRVPQ
ncbi:MAG: nuclease-related domain-containing protein [Actinopolymorphaceae bacterium]